MLLILIRSIILYVSVILAIRLMGKRQIGELQPTELVITILISNIATITLEDTGIPLISGVIPIFLLVSFEIIMSWITLKNRRIRQLVSGSPQIIIRDGIIDQKQLRELRFSVDDVMESLRAVNIFDISEVQFAIVETTGKISVYSKFSEQNATKKDIGLKGKSLDPPYIIINDGIFLGKSYNALGFEMQWLENILHDKKLRVEDIFIMTAQKDGNYNIIERDI